MSDVKRCAACGKENPVSEMKVCMHHQMHRYVCDSKCMTDFYNPPKKPADAGLEAKVAALEAELAKLRAGQECQTLNQRAFIGTLLNSFPLLNDDGLDETEHHCEWHIQQERKRLHTIVDATRLSLSIATPQPSAVPAGWKLVPVEPTPEMVSAAEEAHMPFGDMDIALRMAILSAPSAPATVQGVNAQLLEALEGMLLHIREPESESEFQWPEHFKKQKAAFAAARAAIAAARKGEQ